METAVKENRQTEQGTFSQLTLVITKHSCRNCANPLLSEEFHDPVTSKRPHYLSIPSLSTCVTMGASYVQTTERLRVRQGKYCLNGVFRAVVWLAGGETLFSNNMLASRGQSGETACAAWTSN